MSFTYSGDPAASDIDAVRFLLGDTVESTSQISDEEIDWLLQEIPNVYFAAAQGADRIASKYVSATAGGTKTKTVGALSISYATAEERSKEYRAMSRSLRFAGAINTPIAVYSGGISISDKEANEQDTDWDRPSFALGMHDYPGANLPPSQFLSTST